MGKPYNQSMMETRYERDGNMDDVVSDDGEEFIDEIENIPTHNLRSPHHSDKRAKLGVDANLLKVDTSKKVHGESVLCGAPLLSPNEELTLLMVKKRPNGPDCNPDEEAAPTPPRSHYSRSSRTSNASSSKVLAPKQQNHGSFDPYRSQQISTGMTTFVDPRTGEVVHGEGHTPVTKSAKFSFRDPDLTTFDQSGILHVSEPVEEGDSKSQSMYQSQLKIGSNDSRTTATPSTLQRRIQANEDDIHEYTTNSIPSRLNLQSVPSSITDNSFSHGTSVESSIEDLVETVTSFDDQESTQDARNTSRSPYRRKSHASPESASYEVNLGITGSKTSNDQESYQEHEVDRPPMLRSIVVSRSSDDSVSHQVEGNKESQRYKYAEPSRGTGLNLFTTWTERKLGHDQRRDWSRWSVYGIGCCLIVGITVGFAVYFVTNDKMTSMDVSNFNTDCKHAKRLTDVTGDAVLGEILPNGRGNVFSGCEIEQEEGYALWYYVDGDGHPMRASTCLGTESLESSDTQVIVLVGDCNSLQCVGGSDQLCGSHGSVGWLAAKDTRYFIVVKGSQSTDMGQFLLTIETLTANDKCEQASFVGPKDSPHFGSTRNATLDERLSVCGGNSAEAPASWFQLKGDGSVMCASVSTETSQKPNFPVILSVLDGSDCNGLNCTGQALPRDDEPWTTDDIAFVTEVGNTYHIVVRGEDDTHQGDFVLDLHPTPPNGVCEKATTLSPGAAPTKGMMMNACHTKPPKCRGSLELPGVWYKVQGTGELLIAHAVGLTCRDDDGNQSQVSIFKSGERDCSLLECVEYITAPCTADNDKVIAQWFTDVGTTYFVLIQSTDESEFEISIEEFIPGGSSDCSTALPVAISGIATLGSTLNATPGDVGDCLDTGAKGVWYVVEGTGSTLEASTCNSGTNFATNVTILNGSCGATECVSSKSITCDDRRSIAYWETVLGQKYFVYVHGQAQSDVGRFALTIKEESLGVENDYCGSAESLMIPSTTYGSTKFATRDDEYAVMCDNAAAAPGVWYTVVGEGRFITASLCGAETQYDSQIHVFEGNGCGELRCLDFNEDGCGIKSVLSWKAVEGQKYYILVSGFSQAVGEFELIVT